jgi:hypothetical protein
LLNDDFRACPTLLQTCRQLRAEYLPLVFQKATIETDFHKLAPTLTTFYRANIKELVREFAKPGPCTIVVRNAARRDVGINVAWLAKFFKRNEGVKIEFVLDGPIATEAMNLVMSLLRTHPTWSDLFSATLAFSNDILRSWTLVVRVMPGGVSWTDKQVREKEFEKVMLKLGLFEQVTPETPWIVLTRRGIGNSMSRLVHGSLKVWAVRHGDGNSGYSIC